MTEHTEGPYQREGRTLYALTETKDRHGRMVLTNRFSASVQGAGPGSANEEELIATAILMQRAPELLKACEVALAYGLKLGFPTDVTVQLHEAISKARGQS